MKAVIGKVSAVDPKGKSFTVSANVKARGREVSKDFEVGWTAKTSFQSKGKRPAQSDSSKIKPGVDVIAHIDTAQASGLVAGQVWHQPSRGGLFLTAAECTDLGGKITDDAGCGIRGGGRRCTTTTGSRCIDEV